MAPSNTAKPKPSPGKEICDEDDDTDEDLITPVSVSRTHIASSGHSQRKLIMEKGRFTVSPVHLPSTSLPIEREPLLSEDLQQSSNLTISPITDDHHSLPVVYVTKTAIQSSPSSSRKPSKSSMEDEGFLDTIHSGGSRSRHESSISKVSDAATIDTFLEEDDTDDRRRPEGRDLYHVDPNGAEVGRNNDREVILPQSDVVVTVVPSQICYENAALNLHQSPSTTEPISEQVTGIFPTAPETVYTRLPPVIITSHPSDTSLPHDPPSESLEISRWDISPARNPDIQFYVGSCMSVASAASSVSFFNTLYAHGYTPICRICHQSASEKRPLTSPCNCTGSLRFVHHSCVMRWLDTRSRQLRRNPKCELCGYQFRVRRKWRSRENLRWTAIPFKDKVMHCIFLLSLISMAICIGVIAMVFKHENPAGMKAEKSAGGQEKTGMSQTEVATLVSGVMFFIAFFTAMLAQMKASWTIWRLVRLFWEANYVLQLESDVSPANDNKNTAQRA